MPRKKTHEEFVQDIEIMYPNKYDFLSEYTVRLGKIKIKYNKCGHIDTVNISSVYEGCDCKECKKNEFQESFKNWFYSLNKSNEFSITGEYINCKTFVKITHKCGYETKIMPYSKKRDVYCPKCHPKEYKNCIPYINDLSVTHPEVYELLEDKELGHKYKAFSMKYAWFICPNCGERIYSKISDVSKYGLSCRRCSMGFSYPERFMGNILNQLNIKYIPQFSPKWADNKRYDFMFKINNKKYIIEMDGGFHSSDNVFNGQTKEETLEIDMLKNKMAKEHNYIMIRIDCNYERFENRYQYILNNILDSKLSKIFDLSIIDFELCNKNSYVSNVKTLVELWNNGIYGYENIKKYVNISRYTIRDYLKFASNCGLINMSVQEIETLNRKASAKNLSKKFGIKVKCNETNEIFDSFAQANKKYHASLCEYFKYNRIYSGHLPDGTPLTWTKINN